MGKRVITLVAALAPSFFAQAVAAAPRCTLPTRIVPHLEEPSAREPMRLLPIGSYTLSLIWMPEHCCADADCALYRETLAHGGRHDGVTLHGLWPDGEGKDWPQYCAPAPILPDAVIADHICATPSPQLIQHEWAKHGSCMAGYTPARYFDLSNHLAAAIRMPRLAALARQPLTAMQLAEAIAGANRGMTAEMMRFNLTADGWLQEIWLCLDTGFLWQVCPAGQGGARGDTPVRLRTDD